MSNTGTPIENVIRYHESGLEQYRMQMALSAQLFEEETIKFLKELKAIKDKK
jgi:hypothetical protein